MIPLPRPDKEVALSDWSSSGEAWTHLPYLARFPARRLPASWEGLLTGRHCAVLESGRTGRYTIVVPDAHQAWRFDASGGATLHQDGGAQALPRNRALEALASWVRAHRAPRLAGWPAFQGGLVVALGYELATELEPVRAAADDLGLPRAVLLDAREALVHDAATGELTAVVLVDAAHADGAGHFAAAEKARRLARVWDHACAQPPCALAPVAEPVAPLGESLDAPAFARAVTRAQALIAAGDTYQVNLSTRLELPPPADALSAYEAVRATNPSPYMAFLRMPGATLACGSPELLVESSAGRLSSRPIAGTRPLTGTAVDDEAFSRELAADSKERAEHLMLVDLLRNDIGRVSAPGTVRVPEFMVIERYSHVMHLVSQVEGARSPAAGPAEIIRALFPGGTVTGAPKVRTMQVIAELEPVARGFYTGSVGWIGASGDLCLNIVIRTLTLVGGRCFVQAGAGIVADSVPEREHAESLRKALALRVALGRVPAR
ncbi:MAG: anthranilate synthase component I family protein [Opitutales bacterium]